MKSLQSVIHDEFKKGNDGLELRLNESIASLLQRRFTQAMGKQKDGAGMMLLVDLHKNILFGDVLRDDEC